MQHLNRTAVKRTALSLALAAICTVLQAGNAADLIFDETALNQVPNGTQVVYSHRVLRPANADTRRVQNGSIRMVQYEHRHNTYAERFRRVARKPIKRISPFKVTQEVNI